jgi:hypothetical protein
LITCLEKSRVRLHIDPELCPNLSPAALPNPQNFLNIKRFNAPSTGIL